MGSARVGSNPANCDNVFKNKTFGYCVNQDSSKSAEVLKQTLPPVGFEPTTPSLRDWCSTTELKRLNRSPPIHWFYTRVDQSSQFQLMFHTSRLSDGACWSRSWFQLHSWTSPIKNLKHGLVRELNPGPLAP